MSDSLPSAGGAFLAASPALEQVSIPEELDADARLMARTAADFVRREVQPARERLEAHDTDTMRRLMQRAGALGLLAGNIPEEYGGLNLPKTTLAALGEAMAGDLSFAVSSGIHAGVAQTPLLQFGTPGQKAHWLPPMAAGETIGAFALSEANAGSDALSARTRATLSRDGRHYALRGVKQWITNAGFADLFTVFAQVDGNQFTAFLVERTAFGVSFGPEEQKLGLHGSSTRRLILDDVRVPIENVIGIVGQGHKPALAALNLGRFSIAVTALGSAKDALRQAAQYATQRRQFGKSLSQFGLIQHKLGEMAIRVFALESMVYRTAGYWDRRLGPFDGAASEEYALECALLKFWGTEVQGYVVDEALQIHGGYGFSEGYAVARAYRDARVFRIFEGTSEINRLTVLDQVFRRLKAGRLTLPISDAIEDAHDGPDGWVAGLRGTVLSTIELVRQTLAGEWREQQEVAGALADMIAALYALESVWLRCQKKPGNALTLAAVQVLGQDLCAQAEQQARYVLAALASGDALRHHIRHLTDRMEPPLFNTIDLRRLIAEAVVADEGYPWD